MDVEVLYTFLPSASLFKEAGKCFVLTQGPGKLHDYNLTRSKHGKPKKNTIDHIGHEK